MKLAYVVQRYGPEIRGGAESHCRAFATRLVERGHDVEVFTTCATDYRTWRNALAPGEFEDLGVGIRRFPVTEERAVDFDRLSAEVCAHPRTAPRTQQEEWMHKQGPRVPGLVEALREECGRFDHVVFVTYLYWTTYFGLQAVRERAVLQPTAHNEPPIYLSIFDDVFRIPEALVFLTEQEKSFVRQRFPVSEVADLVAGIGVQPPSRARVDRGYNLAGSNRYVLYLGRIDTMKGVHHLCSFFTAYREARDETLDLVLIGDPVLSLPPLPGVRVLGLVDEQDKWDLLAAAELVLQPSFYESFGLSLLEGWCVRTPAIVNGFCEVTTRHCERSCGGLCYRSYAEFQSRMDQALGDPTFRRRLGEQGRRYVESYYRWNTVIENYEQFLEGLDGGL